MSPEPGGHAGAAVTRLLALDCAAGACSVAVRGGDTLLAAERIVMDRGHAEALMPMLARVMAAAGLAFDQLDAVAASVGAAFSISPCTHTNTHVNLSISFTISINQRGRSLFWHCLNIHVTIHS